MEGTLDETQSIIFADKRPIEELYDTQKDPWKVCNLAQDDVYREVLDRMREELDDWQNATQDLGLVDERVMKILHYPDGEKPVCTQASCLVFTADSYGQQPTPDEFTLPAQHRLQLFSPTQGCSICFTLGQGEKFYWQVYSEPVKLPLGSHRLRTVVSRIGYQNSDEKVFEITVMSGEG